MSASRRILAASLATVLASPAAAQISIGNLLETRVGRDPESTRFLPPGFEPSASRFSTFEQFRLEWTHSPLRLGLRYETYVASDTLAPEYHEFVRRWAAWTGKHYEITAGNYDAIFGRGLALRAFELPGVVREEFGTPQFGDSRDLDGVRLRLHDERWEVMALQGQPRFADQPPTDDRHGSVEGATAAASLVDGVRAGGNYLRLDSQGFGPGSRQEVGGGFVQLGFDPWLRRAGLADASLDAYVEYDRVTGLALPAVVSSPRARPGEGYGLYWSQSLFLEPLPGLRWGSSYEYKDYQNFELGVNEPPTLVREHTFALLERSTHVMDAGQEQGYQFETSFAWQEAADLTLNWSRAEARRSTRFHERYVELSGHWRGHTLTLFDDAADDATEVPAVLDRDTIGGDAMLALGGPHSFEVDLERQRTEAASFIGAPLRYEDRYGSLSYAWAGRFELAVVRQTTDDPRVATDPTTGEVTRRAFDSLQGSVSLSQHHELLVFWGRRRSGIACTAGTCYMVPAFDGVAARLTSRF